MTLYTTNTVPTKGGLLADSSVWVLSNPDFRQWRDHEDQRLLWVKGDLGKGKTMLLCGIVDHLETRLAQGSRLAYFFCQAINERINNATAVLRGLIYMLLDQDASLVSHMKKKYDVAGEGLFQG
ncbi:Uu.00g137210.m01.CDS01 [Anthostomella pinea]|uniref:Uu.00g137210.m01.CDS01 n=1 Tax=Anthostomella pinea TaxID=933095 RepID=A0AAI8VJ16_9PEZI|nr:Uu.00g137210.m01.CDS01 [Anthostomella pinea]